MNSPAAKTAVALLFICLLITWAAWPKHLPAPDEANRVLHPDGYSIIRPPDWSIERETEATTVVTSNHGWLKLEPAKKGYYPPSLNITVMPQAPDLDELRVKKKYVDGTFHGRPVLLRAGPEKKYWTYEMIFQDQDRWFQLSVSTPDYNDVPTSDWWPYVDSFRYEPEKAVKPVAVTRPTTFHFSIDTAKPATTKASP